MAAIGRVASSRREPFDDDWDAVESAIELDASFGAAALRGLAEFSHIEVVYLFHLVDPATVTTDARRPRGNTGWPEVGIFAQRGKSRPNRIGISTCRLLGVDGTRVRVRGSTRSTARQCSTSSRTCASSARAARSASRTGPTRSWAGTSKRS